MSSPGSPEKGFILIVKSFDTAFELCLVVDGDRDLERRGGPSRDDRRSGEQPGVRRVDSAAETGILRGREKCSTTARTTLL